MTSCSYIFLSLWMKGLFVIFSRAFKEPTKEENPSFKPMFLKDIHRIIWCKMHMSLILFRLWLASHWATRLKPTELCATSFHEWPTISHWFCCDEHQRHIGDLTACQNWAFQPGKKINKIHVWSLSKTETSQPTIINYVYNFICIYG